MPAKSSKKGPAVEAGKSAVGQMLVADDSAVLERPTIAFYGLWSFIRLAWWADKTGRVFSSPSPAVAAGQLRAVETEERHCQRTSDWLVSRFDLPDVGETPQE